MWICNRLRPLTLQSIANPPRRGECSGTPLDPSGQGAVRAPNPNPNEA